MQGQHQQSVAETRPLRVLLVSDFYPPVIGGMERYVQTLARELVRRGHHVAVATQRHPTAPAFEIDEGVRVHRLAGWNRALAPFYDSPERPFHPTTPDPGMMAELRRVVAVECPDVVNAQGWMAYSFLPLKRWSKAKLLVTLHDYGLVCPKKTFMCDDHMCSGPAYVKCLGCASAHYGKPKGLALTTGLRLSTFLHGKVDRYLAVSEAVRRASASGVGQPPRPIEVLPAFIPDDALGEAAGLNRPDFAPQQGNYILFVGTLSAHKGIHVLLDAYAGLSDLAALVVIGAQHGGSSLQVPTNVTLVRNAPHAQVMAAWAHCALGVVPSIWPDPCPLTAIEAMASRRPLVASAVGGLLDQVVDGQTGLLVPPGNVDALREALRALLQDPARRARMGVAARQRARLFMVSTVVERFEQICAEILTEKPAVEHIASLLPASRQ